MSPLPASLAVLLLLGAWPPFSPDEPAPLYPRASVPIAFNRLHNVDELTALLRKLVEARPELLSLHSIGKSVEGRDLWCVTVNNARTGDPVAKPAIYVDASIHGNEIQGSEVCLYLLWYLTEQYDRNPAIRQLVDSRVFYVLPTVNPDGRAHWFDRPNTTSSSRSGTSPRDDDRDGRTDEDDYDDLDGDGQIVQMRRKSPTGRYRPSPDDPRHLVPIRLTDDYHGDRYELLGSEGLDNDGDGRFNEDPPGAYDMNRNYPADWQPQHVQGGAGPFPLCWPETRAVADFILARPNIATVVALHNAGGMILRGPGHPGRQSEHPAADDQVLEALASSSGKLLPGYRSMVTNRDLYPVRGSFTDWTYEHLGIFSYVVELWNNDQLLSRPTPDGGSPLENAVGLSGAAAQLFASDRLLHGGAFVDWHPFDHPRYGPIELGGFVKQSQRIPPPFLIEELCHRASSFVIDLAGQLPAPEWDTVRVEPLGGNGNDNNDDDNGTFLIVAAVRNPRLIPTVSAQAAQRRLNLPDTLSVAGDQVSILAGGRVTDRDTGRFDPVAARPERLRLEAGVPGRDVVEVRWLVRGSGPITLRYHSQKGGSLEQTLSLP